MKKTDVSKDWHLLITSSKFDPGLDSAESLRHELTVPRKNALLPTNNSIFVESLIDQLCRLLERDPKEQRKIYNAICAKLCDLRLIDESYRQEEFSSLRGHYRQALSTFLQSPDVRAPLLETSRYCLEFEELGWIASGGFGQVFQARHRLDQVVYAVKKIKVRYKDAAFFVPTLAEVKTLARLNHVNIVQYKAAWLEASPEITCTPVIVDATDSSNSDGVVFQHSSDDGTEGSNGDSLAVCRFQPLRSHTMQVNALLYVCMQLCDETLRQWLDRRNTAQSAVDLKLALDIVRQAAAGIAYIHNCNVVHHDIKPSNIFITHDMHVQVGDFGLACTLQGGACPVGAGQRGTGLYAAPEQLRGQCHQRSDLFSLGLVLVELLTPFATAMERVAVLSKARGRQLPADLPPTLQDLIKSLTAPKPDWRPSADTLLEQLSQLRNEFFSHTRDIAEMDKDFTINELRRQLAERDCEIKKLKQSLSLSSDNKILHADT